MMTELEKYYNKFNEEKRLGSRHGQVEFTTSMKYIHEYPRMKIKGKKRRVIHNKSQVSNDRRIIIAVLQKSIKETSLICWLAFLRILCFLKKSTTLLTRCITYFTPKP